MSAKLVAMQARAFPPPGLAGAGRNDLFPGSVGRRGPAAVRAVDGPSAAAAVAAGADIPPAQVTWQIVVGAVAGVTPFVVAGVEFGKRIIAQKKCEVCGGSGLVMKNDYYVRCQGWFSSMAVLEKILQRLKMVMRHLDHHYQSTTTSKDGQGKKSHDVKSRPIQEEETPDQAQDRDLEEYEIVKVVNPQENACQENKEVYQDDAELYDIGIA